MIHDKSDQAEAPEHTSLLVGALASDNFSLQGFYPDDLPEDWRAGFYANEFRTVCIPLAEFPEDEDRLEEWLDLPDGFVVYISLDSDAQRGDERLKYLKTQLGGHLGGVSRIAPGDIDESLGLALIDTQGQNLRKSRAWLEQHAADLNAVILCDEGLNYATLSDFRSLVELMNL